MESQSVWEKAVGMRPIPRSMLECVTVCLCCLASRDPSCAKDQWVKYADGSATLTG